MSTSDAVQLAVAIAGGVAAIAAAVAAVFAYQSADASRDLVEIERARWATEREGAQRARLRAIAGHVGSNPRLKLINDGPADALNVTLRALDRRTGQASTYSKEATRARMQPGDSIVVVVNVGANVHEDPNLDAAVDWTDGTGEHFEVIEGSWRDPRVD